VFFVTIQLVTVSKESLLSGPAYNEYRALRHTQGVGFEALHAGFEPRANGIYGVLKQRRPFYLINDYSHQPRQTKDLVKNLMIERLGIYPEDSELITSIHLGELDNRLAGRIMQDRSRPVILPVSIGGGDNPHWWIGPFWMFYTPFNVHAFQNQIAAVRLPHSELT
jgi:hypothetical protein